MLADNEPMVTLLHEVGARALATDAGVVTFDIPLEPWKDHPGGLVDRLFHAAAGSVGVLLRRLALPAGPAGPEGPG